MSTDSQTQFAPSLPDSSWVPSPLHRLTLDEYEAMVASGAFSPRDRFHLINGYLVDKMTQNDPHCTADDLCGVELSKAISSGWYLRSGKPVRLPPNSKPEPDRCVVLGTIRDYSHRSPGPADVGLVVEVSDTSLGEDRKLAQVYGGSGIPIYWIINLVDKKIEVYAEPGPAGYTSRIDYVAGQEVPVVLDGNEVGRVRVADVLP
jgi:Uma2 family endonuclease